MLIPGTVAFGFIGFVGSVTTTTVGWVGFTLVTAVAVLLAVTVICGLVEVLTLSVAPMFEAALDNVEAVIGDTVTPLVTLLTVTAVLVVTLPRCRGVFTVLAFCTSAAGP